MTIPLFKTRLGRWNLLRGLSVVLCLCLSACTSAKGAGAQEALDQTSARGSSAVSMVGYNYTDEGVQEFYVNDSRVSNLPAHGGGGARSCCAMLPNTWHEGLTVRVDWTIGRYTVPYEQRKHLSFIEQGRYWSERTLQQIVPVQRYAEPSTLQVFFLPDDKLEVWVTSYDLGHPQHPSGRTYSVNPNTPRKPQTFSVPQEK